MVKYCVAYGCKELQKKGSGIQFHRFPFSRPDILKKWVQAIRREHWLPTAYSALCSKHFTPDCYQPRPGAPVKLLKEDAVPSVFNIPGHLPRKIVARRQLVRKELVFNLAKKNRRILKRCRIDENVVAEDRHTTAAAVGDTSSTTTTNSSSNCSRGLDKEHNYFISPCPSTVKKKYEEILSRKQHQIDKYRQALKCAKEKLEKQAKKIQKLETLFEELKSKNIISNDLQIR